MERVPASDSETDWRPGASAETLRTRAKLLATIRSFFAERDVLEVETPVLGEGNVPDPHVSGLRLEAADAGDGHGHLQTSPEIAMKRLVAAHRLSCFQICRAFRAGESGPRHLPEFTLLEWYRVGWDSGPLIDEVVDLVRTCRSALHPEAPSPAVRRWTHRRLFEEVCDLDPGTAGDAEVVRCGLSHGAPEGLDREASLDFLLSHHVEPTFPEDTIVVVDRFPASQAALARTGPDADGVVTAERFEVYLGRLELANGYHELTDAAEQARRLRRDRRRRTSLGLPDAGSTAHLLGALEAGLPDCAGVALGVDRLLMGLVGARRIDEVVAFR